MLEYVFFHHQLQLIVNAVYISYIMSEIMNLVVKSFCLLFHNGHQSVLHPKMTRRWPILKNCLLNYTTKSIARDL